MQKEQSKPNRMAIDYSHQEVKAEETQFRETDIELTDKVLNVFISTKESFT